MAARSGGVGGPGGPKKPRDPIEARRAQFRSAIADAVGGAHPKRLGKPSVEKIVQELLGDKPSGPSERVMKAAAAAHSEGLTLAAKAFLMGTGQQPKRKVGQSAATKSAPSGRTGVGVATAPAGGPGVAGPPRGYDDQDAYTSGPPKGPDGPSAPPPKGPDGPSAPPPKGPDGPNKPPPKGPEFPDQLDGGGVSLFGLGGLGLNLQPGSRLVSVSMVTVAPDGNVTHYTAALRPNSHVGSATRSGKETRED